MRHESLKSIDRSADHIYELGHPGKTNYVSLVWLHICLNMFWMMDWANQSKKP